MDLHSAFAVTDDYHVLMMFEGWFIPLDVHRDIDRILKEIVMLRTFRDNQGGSHKPSEYGYEALTTLGNGKTGWFVADKVRAAARKALQEIVILRAGFQ